MPRHEAEFPHAHTIRVPPLLLNLRLMYVSSSHIEVRQHLKRWCGDSSCCATCMKKAIRYEAFKSGRPLDAELTLSFEAEIETVNSHTTSLHNKRMETADEGRRALYTMHFPPSELQPMKSNCSIENDHDHSQTALTIMLDLETCALLESIYFGLHRGTVMVSGIHSTAIVGAGDTATTTFYEDSARQYFKRSSNSVFGGNLFVSSVCSRSCKMAPCFTGSWTHRPATYSA